MALLSVAEALERVLAQAEPLPAEEVPLGRRRRPRARLRSQSACAPSRRPTSRPWTAMPCAPPMSADAPVRLKVIGEVAAGRPFAAASVRARRRAFSPAACCRKAPNAIVIQELTKRDGDFVEVQKPTGKGRNVRPQGLDFREAKSFSPRAIGSPPRDLQLAAGMNHPLVPGASPAEARAVRNRRRIGAARDRAGAGADRLFERLCARRAGPRGRRRRHRSRRGPRQARRHHRRRSATRAGCGADILVTTGGASVGEYDFVQQALRRGRHGACRSGRSRCGPAARSCTAGSAPWRCSACPAIRSRPTCARSCFWCR